MRRLLAGFVVTLATALVPCLAMAGNQESAEQIAKNLRVSGQMHDYKIGVKFQDGIVTLRGQVSSEEQMKTAIAPVSKMQGVTQVINNLTINASDMSATPALQQPDSLARLQAAAKTEPVAKMQPAARPNSVSNATFVSNGAPVAARPVAATEEQSAPAAAAVPTRVVRPVPVAYAQADATAPQPAAAPAPDAGGRGADGFRNSSANGCSPNSFVRTHGWGRVSARFDHAHLPNYAWPSYASYPNYGAVTYPRQYSATAWPYIGPFYPYPQVPLGWRKVTLEWKDGWWFLDFKDRYKNSIRSSVRNHFTRTIPNGCERPPRSNPSGASLFGAHGYKGTKAARGNGVREDMERTLLCLCPFVSFAPLCLVIPVSGVAALNHKKTGPFFRVIGKIRKFDTA